MHYNHYNYNIVEVPLRDRTCDEVGQSGQCGVICEVYLDGKCTVADEVDYENLTEEYDNEDIVWIIQLYSSDKYKEMQTKHMNLYPELFI